MSDLHPDHVTPVLALEDQDACSPLVLRSAGLQAAKIIRKLTNDLGYREQENTRLRSDLAAAQEREQSVAAALRRIATPEAFFVATSNIDPEALGRMIYAQAVLGGASLDEAAAKAEAECKRRAVLGEPQ